MTTDKPTLKRISEAAIIVRNAGYPDVAAWIMSKELRER